MTDPHTRAADLDRSRACAVLDQAYADGQLDAAEHKTRLDDAMAAKTLTELHALVADLQPTGDQPSTAESAAKPRGRRAIWLAGAAGLVAGALIATLAIQGTRSDPSPAASQGQAANDAKPIVVSVPRLHTVDGFTAFVDATRGAFGDAMVTHATIYPDHADVVRAIAGTFTGALHYYYRGGYQTPTPATRATDAPDADLGKLNVAKIIGLVAGAAQSLRVDNPTVYFDIDGTSGGTVTIHASNGFAQSGTLIAGFDGTVRQVNPFTS